MRYAIRSLLRSPALTAVAIGSLALGIGANVTVYSVVRELAFEDLTAQRPGQLVRTGGNASYDTWLSVRTAGVFQDLAFYRSFQRWNWRAGDHSELVWAIPTSANFFDVLGVRAAAGRLYSQSDNGRDVAVISHAFWQRRMGGDPGAAGRTIEAGGRLYTVIGVLPWDYRSVYGLGVSPEVYAPARVQNPRDAGWIVFGRMRDGATRAGTQQVLEAAVESLSGTDFARRFAALRPMAGFAAHTYLEGGGVYLFFVALFWVAGLMALIASSNVAGLLLARALSRRREIAIRRALGAGRWPIFRQLLAEGLAMVMGAGAVGLLLHSGLSAGMRSLRFPSAYGVPFEFHFQYDGGLMGYAAAVAAVALLASSLFPALQASRGDLSLATRQGEPGFSYRRWNLRTAMVAAQMTLAMLLLTIGALFTRSFVKVATADPGFALPHLVMAGAQPAPGGNPAALRERLLRRLEAVPGVTAVSSTWVLPLAGEMPSAPVRRDGDAVGDSYVPTVGERYFETMGIPILRGRDFTAADLGRKPRPAIANRTLARRIFGDGEPVGQVLRIGRDREETVEVIGVAADSRMRSLGEGEQAALYLPEISTGLLVRVAGDAAQWTGAIRQAMASVDPTAALDVRPMSDAAAGAIFPLRMAAMLLGSLSALGLLLAVVGLYAAVAYATGRRTREVGIRVALGATHGRILWVAARDGFAVLVVGGIAGLSLAAAAIRPLAGLVPAGINPWDPALFGGVFVVLFAAGGAAALIPARRAAGIDPSAALRQD